MDRPGAVWQDRKRIIFGLPWTFTKYVLTKEKLLIQTGILNTKEEEVRLYRIMDVTLRWASACSAWAPSTAARRTNPPPSSTSSGSPTPPP